MRGTNAGWTTCKTILGKPCIGGLDLATTTDINALVLLFKVAEKYRILPFFWCPEAALRSRERANRQRIDHWSQQGYIKLTDGNCVDYGVIRRDINDLGGKYKIKEIALDPWNATSLATDLMSDGFKVEYVQQGYYSLSPACKEFEKLVLTKQIEHPGNPVLDWMFGNVTVAMDAAGNVKPDKGKSQDKIDGVSALITALARMIKKMQPRKSVYEDRGVQTI